jgi:hypothetical protein
MEGSPATPEPRKLGTIAEDRHVVLVGYGKFPQNTSAEQVHQVLAIAVRLDWASNRIIDASTTLLTRVAEEFICELLSGMDLNTGAEGFIERIKTDYHGHAQKAIIAAFRDLIGRYEELAPSSG